MFCDGGVSAASGDGGRTGKLEGEGVWAESWKESGGVNSAPSNGEDDLENG